MRPTERQRQPKHPHLVHQAQPALEAALRHPAALLLAAPRHPPPRRLLHEAQHLRRCRCPTPSTGRDALDAEPRAGEAEAEEVPGGEEEAGDGEGGLVRRGGEEVGVFPRPAARGAHGSVE